jgi:hypothetical protein
MIPPKRHEISIWRGWRFESSVCSAVMPSEYHTQTKCNVKMSEGLTINQPKTNKQPGSKGFPLQK